MKLKLPVFMKRERMWALVTYDPDRREGFAICENGDKAEAYLRPDEVEKMEVRAFVMREPG